MVGRAPSNRFDLLLILVTFDATVRNALRLSSFRYVFDTLHVPL